MAVVSSYNLNDYNMIFNNDDNTVGYNTTFNSKKLFSCDNSNIDNIIKMYDLGYIEDTVEDIKKDLRAKTPLMIIIKINKKLDIFEGFWKKGSSVKITGTYFYKIGKL